MVVNMGVRHGGIYWGLRYGGKYWGLGTVVNIGG